MRFVLQDFCSHEVMCACCSAGTQFQWAGRRGHCLRATKFQILTCFAPGAVLGLICSELPTVGAAATLMAGVPLPLVEASAAGEATRLAADMSLLVDAFRAFLVERTDQPLANALMHILEITVPCEVLSLSRSSVANLTGFTRSSGPVAGPI